MASSLLGQAVFRVVSETKSFIVGMKTAGMAAKKFAFDAKAIAASMKKVSMGAMMAAAGIAMAFAPVILIGGKFERSMSKVGAILRSSITKDMERGSQATEHFKEVMKNLGNEAERLGATTRYSASEAAEAMSYLAMAGFDADQILGATAATLTLAAAGGLDLATAADIASDATTAFGLSAASMPRVIDTMAMAASRSNTSVLQMGEAFKYAAPMLAVMGVNAEETAAMLGMLGNAGMKGSIAGTSLGQAFSQLAKKGEEMNGVLQQFGLSFEDINPEIHDSSSILTQLAASTMGATELIELFGIRGGRAIAAMVTQIRNAPGAFVDLHSAMQNSVGTAAQMMEDMENNTKGRFTILASAFQGLMITIFQTMSESLGNTLKSIGLMISNIQNWVKENDVLVGKIAKVVAVLGGLLAAVGGATAVIGALAGAFLAIKAAVATFAGVTLGLLIAKFVALLPLFAGIAAAVYIVIQVWDELKELAIALWEGAIKPFWEGLKGTVAWMWSMLKPVFDWFIGILKSAIKTFSELWKSSALVRGVFKALGAIIAVVIATALAPILIKIGLAILAFKALVWVWDKLRDAWIGFLRIFGMGKDMETSTERAERLRKEKERLIGQSEEWREAQQSELDTMGEHNAAMLKQAELAKLGANATLKQKKELLALMKEEGNLIPQNAAAMKQEIDAAKARRDEIQAMIDKRKEHGLSVEEENKMLSEAKMQLEQLETAQDTLFDKEGKRREGVIHNTAALEADIKAEEHRIKVKKEAEEATESLKNSESKLGELRKALEKQYASGIDGEIAKLDDLHQSYIELVEQRHKDMEAKKIAIRLTIAETKARMAQTQAQFAEAIATEKNIAKKKELIKQQQLALETAQAALDASNQSLSDLDAAQAEEADLITQHAQKTEEEKQNLLDEAAEKRRKMERDRKIEEAKLSGDRLLQVKLENEKRLEEAEERINKELELSEHMTEAEKKRVLAERKAQMDLVKAQNEDRLKQVQDELDGREELPKQIEKERDLEAETWKIMLGKVKSMRDLYHLHMMMHKLNHIRENRSLIAAKKLQQAELKLANLKKIKAQGGNVSDADIRNAELEAQHMRFRADARMAEAKQEEGVIEERKKRLETLNEAFAQLKRKVQESRAQINATIGMISMDFLEAPWKWVEQWMIGWEVQSQRMLDAVRNTMAQMKHEMHPDTRHSPSFRDVWSMNAKVVDDSVNSISAKVGGRGVSAGRMGGIAPSMGIKTLNDSRNVNMTVNNKMDGAAVTRQIGRSLSKNIARRGSI